MIYSSVKLISIIGRIAFKLTNELINKLITYNMYLTVCFHHDISQNQNNKHDA